MTNRERVRAILNYQPYDTMPIVHFGFWTDTLERWAAEGHITQEEADSWGDGNPVDIAISAKLGFDFNYYSCFSPHTGLSPNSSARSSRNSRWRKKVRNAWGVIELEKPGATSIPAEIDHLLKTAATGKNTTGTVSSSTPAASPNTTSS